MSHDDYCPSRMGRQCECELIAAARADERNRNETVMDSTGTTVQTTTANLHPDTAHAPVREL